MAVPGLPHHLAVLGDVVVGHTVNGLAVSDASQIIGITDNMAALGGFGELPTGAAGGLDLRHCTASSANLCNHNGYLISNFTINPRNLKLNI